MENGWRSELILYVEGAVFGLKTDMHVAKVQLFLQKDTLSFSNLTLTLKFLMLTILYFEEQNFLIRLRAVWVEKNFNL